MPTPATLLLIATLLPLLGFVILLFVGKKMGSPLAGWVGTLMIGLSFLCSIGAMMSWYSRGTHHGIEWGFERSPILLTHGWIPVGGGVDQAHPGFLDVGIYVDSLTICMFAMITLVATLVHVFSIGYMREDVRYPRFFTYLGLFCFSMLGLVIGGTLLQLFIFWELVGLCSYLLIGFWYEKRSASNAAIKAFVANRVGDFGFLIGFGILFYHLGNATLPALWNALGGAGMVDGRLVTELALPGGVAITSTLLTVMGIGLFFGAVGKSAQFPLHVWLPDAMEGPTPVSALIHAATMVAAGVYLVGRIFPVLTPDAKLFIAIIGCTTLTMAALIAVAQTDIKKVLAYSTLSQLGYMILAMGIGSWVGALFHLITHAFFKALLFLGSGSVIHAAHHEQELPQYGGLMRKIPVTAITFGIAVLAIAGTPGLSGYYSKDLILADAGAFWTLAHQEGRSGWYKLLFWMPAAIAFVTPFYMTRAWMLTFAGKPRNARLHEHAHESPVMYGPLIVLAVLSVIAGYALNVKELLIASTIETKNCVQATYAGATFRGFDTTWPPTDPTVKPKTPDLLEGGAAPPHADRPADVVAHHDPHEAGWHYVHTVIFWGFIVGIALGVVVYWNGYWIAGPLTRRGPLAYVRTWLYRRMYFDELYHAVFINAVLTVSWLSAVFDRYVVDGLVNGAAWLVRRSAVVAGLHDRYVIDGAVNGVATVTQDLGAAVRAPQSGRIRMYVTILMAAVALGVAVAILVALS
ncbi:MAG TPA: NADH-quinone oxidoreductase subunit L [Tepidisphaeraceae bacterium]|nr:NADH-quinone oxidoreductase subunit L [Tepidisphaeraceae bacterium]